MADILKFRKPKASEKHRGQTLCRSGFHKWVVDRSHPFEVKKGKLLTHYRCARCNARKAESR